MSRRSLGTAAVVVVAAAVVLIAPRLMAADKDAEKHAAVTPVAAAAKTGPHLTEAQLKAAKTIMDNPSYSCFTCHAYKGKGGLPNVPTYDNVGMRRSAEWMEKWIHDPKAMKPGTVMPTLKLTEKQVETLVTFLVAQKHDVASEDILKAAKTPVEAGAKLVGEYDCQACHMLAKKGKSQAPDLSHIGKKYTAAQLSTWITAPTKLKKDAWGPAYDVSEAEASAMAAYLSTLK